MGEALAEGEGADVELREGPSQVREPSWTKPGPQNDGRRARGSYAVGSVAEDVIVGVRILWLPAKLGWCARLDRRRRPAAGAAP